MTQRKIFKVISSNPGISQKEIAELIKMSSSTVNYNIKFMVKLGVIKLDRDGKVTKCFENDKNEQ